MFNKQFAENTLEISINDLQVKKGHLTIGDLEAETINNACLLLLKHYPNQISSVHDVTLLGGPIKENKKFSEMASWFVDYASHSRPDIYFKLNAESAKLSIIQNISWAGMWDFLRGYFFKTHGISIDDEKSNFCTFDSIRHERFENGILTSSSIADRKIIINFTNEKQNAMISIEPTLSSKSAILFERNGNTLNYNGQDRDYAFTILLNRFDQIERFVLKMPNKSLELLYYA